MSVVRPVSASQPGRGTLPASPTGSSNRPPLATADPHTPISPGLMSISSPRDDSPSTTHTYASHATATPQLMSSTTSPSTVAMSTQASQQLLTSVTGQAFSTPASSVERSGPPYIRLHDADEDGDGDVRMGLGGDETVEKTVNLMAVSDGATSQVELEHRRTDHERQEMDVDVKAAVDDSRNSQERANDRLEGVDDQTRPASAQHRPGLKERLQADVGPLYLLCRSSHPVMRPHPTQDLLSLYSLQPLAATVARSDPVTGEKRKIRKTYKGKIQAFGLAGRNQEVKHPEGQPGGLVEMMSWPDEEWQNQKVAGKEMEKELGETVMAKLDRAVKMRRGRLAGFDASVLGLDAPGPVSTSAESKRVAAGTARQQPGGQALKAVTNISPSTHHHHNNSSNSPEDPARPRRTGKKRRYDEDSFEGYGEGFVDDDVEMTGGGGGGGYASSEREGRLGVKKRKKNLDPYNSSGGTNTTSSHHQHPPLTSSSTTIAAATPSQHQQPQLPPPAAPPPGLIERRGSYGVGMVGIGRNSSGGLGAYGA